MDQAGALLRDCPRQPGMPVAEGVHRDPRERIEVLLPGLVPEPDARTAAAHPLAEGHSLWEILNHVTAWTRAVQRRLNGEAVELTGADDWPPVSDASDAAWQAAVESFRAAQQDLLAKLKSMSNDELGMFAPGQKYSYSFMLNGLVQHHLYHAGQMALLKKSSVVGRESSGT